jgi:hypothetical protein
MGRISSIRKKHGADALRSLLIAIGSAIDTYAAQHAAPGVFAVGCVLLVIGVGAVIIARIDCETMISLALQQPASTTREQLAQMMNLPYCD